MNRSFPVLRYLSVCLFVNLLQAGMFAQTPIEFEQIKARFPDDPLCYLKDNQHLDLTIEKGKLKIVNHHATELLFISDKSNSYADRSIFYYDDYQVLNNIEAITYVPDGRKYKKLKVDNIYSRKPVKEGVFFDDFQEKYFFFPGIIPGAIGSTSYDEEIKDPHFFSPFYFANYVPTLHSEYSITFPKEVKIRYIFFGDSTGVKFEKKESRDKITYKWWANDINKLREENDAPDISYYAQHLVIYVEQYEADGKTVKVLSDVKQLYSWYTQLTEKVNTKEDPYLKHLTDSIVQGAKTDEEKVKRIFYWVQSNIKYIAFEAGLGGFVPREASVICQKKFGDCKDKSSIQYVMLRLAGVPAYLTWIGTRSIPYSYYKVPTPQVDNHMIAAVKMNGKWVFLDGTAAHLQYGYPTAMIQGKEALIGISKDSFQIITVPAVAYNLNRRNDSIMVKLSGNLITGSAITTFNGLWKSSVVNSYSSYAQKKRKEAMERLFTLGNNKFKLDSLSCTGFEDRDSLLTCKYTYTLPDYVKTIDDEIYINMHLDHSYQNDIIDTLKKKYDKELSYKFTFSESVSLQIPPGYKLSKLPENKKLENELFGFHVTYTQMADKIVMRREVFADYLVLKKNRFSEWNKMITELNKAYKEVVVLQKKK